MEKHISKDELKFYTKLGINVNSNYFRQHYENGLLDNIDENYVKEVQDYYSKHYKQIIDPITHIAYTNLTGIKDVKILPQRIFRKQLLRVFNDNPLTDIYRDKALYELMFDTKNQVYNVIKRVRRQYYNHDNEPISYLQIFNILIKDSNEYIIKPTDTNNGLGIKKIFVKNEKLYIDDLTINSNYLDTEYGYNFVIQRVIKQHENMAYLHPSSVNTLRMVTMRWNNKIEVIYTFARFGHSGDIKDNAGAGGIVVGVKKDGNFMNYGIQNSKIIYKHPTTGIKIHELKNVPNYSGAKTLARKLHRQILHHNYVAWDITINQNNEPIFIEPNFFGNSWTNQIALQQPMLGEFTAEILEYIAKNQKKVNDLDIESLAKENRVRFQNRRKKLNLQIKEINKELLNGKDKYKDLRKQLKKAKAEKNKVKKEIKEIKNSKSWRYTKIFRKK